jgi:hypothetical protein
MQQGRWADSAAHGAWDNSGRLLPVTEKCRGQARRPRVAARQLRPDQSAFDGQSFAVFLYLMAKAAGPAAVHESGIGPGRPRRARALLISMAQGRRRLTQEAEAPKRGDGAEEEASP